MIYVTHDQAEAMILSDRIAVMEGGEIRQCGAPEEIYNRPANRFVAGFIGTPPMNFAKGRFLTGETFRIDFGTGLFSFSETGLDVLPEKARGSDFIFGFRPEEVLLSLRDSPRATKGTIEVLEPMGSETWALFTVGEKAFRGKARPIFRPDRGIPSGSGSIRRSSIFSISNQENGSIRPWEGDSFSRTGRFSFGKGRCTFLGSSTRLSYSP